MASLVDHVDRRLDTAISLAETRGRWERLRSYLETQSLALQTLPKLTAESREAVVYCRQRAAEIGLTIRELDRLGAIEVTQARHGTSAVRAAVRVTVRLAEQAMALDAVGVSLGGHVGLARLAGAA